MKIGPTRPLTATIVGERLVPSRRNRREAILAAAIALFDQHGFTAVSLDDIGAAAGITGPGIYRHFATKQDILVTAFERAWERMSSELASAIADDEEPRLQLRAAVESYTGIAIDNRALISVYLRETHSLPADHRPRERRMQRLYIQQWVRLLRALHPELSDAVARTAVQATIGLINAGALSGSKLTTTERRRLLTALALEALNAIDDRCARTAAGANRGRFQ